MEKSILKNTTYIHIYMNHFAVLKKLTLLINYVLIKNNFFKESCVYARWK